LTNSIMNADGVDFLAYGIVKVLVSESP
jgi:hypothetical protein